MCLSELRALLIIWQTRQTPVTLEIHKYNSTLSYVELDADTWTIIVFVYISLGLTSEKSKFPQSV